MEDSLTCTAKLRSNSFFNGSNINLCQPLAYNSSQRYFSLAIFRRFIITGRLLLYELIQNRLNKFIHAQQHNVLCGGLKGLEKESLRVNCEGKIAQTPHPEALGAALTNPYITTDYSEALLEFITPPFEHTTEALNFMRAVHSFTYQHLSDEMLWGSSMPCIVDGDMSIPIAHYGDSNIGKMKHVYRVGLWHRYGRSMQAIAGIHFNYSLPLTFWPIYQQLEENNAPQQDFISQSYMDMSRNIHRYGWIILYLFGASPAICKSFLKGQSHNFESFDDNTLYKPYSTSLRMSDIGYKNDGQSNINISYNSLDSYIKRLQTATQTPYPLYQEIALKDAAGHFKQLNENILQIENEYYSNVRPKQITQTGETPSDALKKRGVRYVELRSVDINPFDPVGINSTQLHFLEAFMIFCLLAESPSLSAKEKKCVDANLTTVAVEGRKPDLQLQRKDQPVSLKTWGLDICHEMQLLCELLDGDNTEAPYMAALKEQISKFNHVELTPSAKILASMTEHRQPFFKFAMQQAQQHNLLFNEIQLSDSEYACFKAASQKSIQQQRELESEDSLPFSNFLAEYFKRAEANAP